MSTEFVNLFEWIRIVMPDEFPPPPFEMQPGVKVIETAVWLKALQNCAYPDHPRARYGALQCDLRNAYRVWKEM